MPSPDRLTRRADFVAAREGVKAVSHSMVLQWLPGESESGCRAGLTVSSKVGNAVVRNRVKRKLRPLLRQCAKESLLPDGRLVVIARQDAHTHPSEILNRDLRYCLRQLKKNLAKQAAAKAAILPETS